MKNIGVGLLIVVALYIGWQVMKQANNEPSRETQEIDAETEKLRQETDRILKERETQSP